MTQRPPARGMVATAFPAATEAGRDVLRDGGTAMDAAVAAAWALAVCEPAGSGLGGQTVVLWRSAAGRAGVLDGHSHAPRAVTRREVTRAQQDRGHRAATVPTTPATLSLAHRLHGRLPWARVLAPAVRLAEEGFVLTPLQRRQLGWCRDALLSTPGGAMFLGPGGAVPDAGTVIRQPRLAAGLRRIAEHGAEDVYAGAIARAIVGDMTANGGLMDAEDLARAWVTAPAEVEAVSVPYRGLEVMTAPPPGGGPALLLALRSLDTEAPGGWSAADERRLAVARAVNAAFAERERLHSLPATRRAVLAAEGAGETTHVCVADAEGAVVSLTQSIQSLYGAKAANPEYGFLYNNYLTTCPRRPHAHRLGPGSTARSNASPVVVCAPASAGAAPLLVAGAAGSRRIVSSVAHVITGVVDAGLGVEEAVAAPRVHALLDGRAWEERGALTEPTRRALEVAGFRVERRARLSYRMGAVQALALDADGGVTGAADPRRDGTAEAT